MGAETPATTDHPLFEYVLHLADDRLVLGHRLSEWCGHAPILEEELALGNVALDLIGQAAKLLDLASRIENRGRDADRLAFFRDPADYRNAQLVEQPNGDFASTIARQLFFDAYDLPLTLALRASAHSDLAAWATAAAKEARYHLRHSREWVRRLGLGTAESRRRLQDGVDRMWRFTEELFDEDALEADLVGRGIAVAGGSLRGAWRAEIVAVLAEAGIQLPESRHPAARGGRRGVHGEALERMLSEMQSLARAHPGAEW